MEKPKLLAASRPSAALRAAYQKRLDSSIEDMHRSIMRWILAAYRANPHGMAQDESPARALQKIIRKVGARWQAHFNALADELAKYFATKASERVDSTMHAALRNHGFTVRFKLTAAQNDAYQACIGENVGLIRSIASEHLSDVEGIVMRAIQAGHDLGALSTALQENYGVTKRRAALIARDQSNKATATFTRVRSLELGITRAVWRHSAGGKVPRASHVAFNGKSYDIAKGAYIDGEWIWPGTEINCRCVAQPIIEGFSP